MSLGRSRHDFKTQAREELWIELSLCVFLRTTRSHYPLKHMCQVSSIFWEKRSQTALSISRIQPFDVKGTQLELWQADTHATKCRLPAAALLFRLAALRRSNTTACKAELTASSVPRFKMLSWIQLDGICLVKSMDREQMCVFRQHIRDKGLATQPFEDHWHTSAFTSLGPLGGKPVEHFQYVLLLPLEAWDCHA